LIVGDPTQNCGLSPPREEGERVQKTLLHISQQHRRRYRRV